MRPPSSFRRVASLLLGCWLAVFAAEPAALHVCAVHDVGGSMHHASHHGSPAPSHHTGCTCPGACCPGVGVRIATAPSLPAARVVAVVEPDIAARARVRPGGVRVVLPPAIGPPVYFG